MGITQKEIARDLGVSLITVSRTLNNTGYVSAKLRKRILDYARKKSYEPHRASQVLARSTARKIAVFSPAKPEYFWDDIKLGVMLAAEQIKFFNYEVHYHRIPDYDTDKYRVILRKEIKNGLDIAAFTNQSTFDIENVVSLAGKSGLPYIMYNVDAPLSRRICYIGANYYAGGRLAANFIGYSLKAKKTRSVLTITFIQENEKHEIVNRSNSDRLHGFLDVMREQFPMVSCISEYVKSGSPEKRINALLAYYQGKVDAVYLISAFNDPFHKALERYDYRNVITLQHDIDKAALQALEAGILTAVVYQDPILQGYTAVRTMENILERKTIKKLDDIDIAYTLVFKENINFIRNHHLLLGNTWTKEQEKPIL